MCPITRRKGQLDTHFVNRTKTKTLLYLSSFTQNKLGEEPKLKNLEGKVSHISPVPGWILTEATALFFPQAGCMDKWHHSCVQWGVVWDILCFPSCDFFPWKWSSRWIHGYPLPPKHRDGQEETHMVVLTVPWARWIGSSRNHWGNQHTKCPKLWAFGWHLVKDNCSLLVSTHFWRPKPRTSGKEAQQSF